MVILTAGSKIKQWSAFILKTLNPYTLSFVQLGNGAGRLDDLKNKILFTVLVPGILQERITVRAFS